MYLGIKTLLLRLKIAELKLPKTIKNMLGVVISKAEDVCIYYDIRIRRPVRGFFYDLYYGFKNLWDFKGLIWKDRDWDHYYLYNMMAFKLRRIGRLMIDHGNATVSKHHGMKALIAAECAHRLAEHDRTLDHEWFDKRVPDDYFDFSLSEPDPITKCSRMIRKYDEDKHYDRLFKIAVKRQEKQRQFYKDLLYKLMKRYGDNFWD
jgi:hypothetical protein